MWWLPILTAALAGEPSADGAGPDVVPAEPADAEPAVEPAPADPPRRRRGPALPPARPDVHVHFPTLAACIEHGREVASFRERLLIGRFDARWRRCERVTGGYAWRETHAPILLDPVVEPALLLGPAIGLAVGARRYDDLAARGVDRWVDDHLVDRPHALAGYDEPVGRWAEFSEAWLGTTVGLAALPLLTSRGNARFTDTLIMGETLLVDFAIARGVAARRAEPRPYVSADLRAWDADDLASIADDLDGPEAWASAGSMHTSLTAASTFGLATLWATRREPTPLAAIPYGLAALATALEGSARVLALQEDPADVALGALTGAAVGALVPLTHVAVARVIDPDRRGPRRRKGAPASVTVVPDGPGVAVVGTW